jgi:hypothetical protein
MYHKKINNSNKIWVYEGFPKYFQDHYSANFKYFMAVLPLNYVKTNPARRSGQ